MSRVGRATRGSATRTEIRAREQVRRSAGRAGDQDAAIVAATAARGLIGEQVAPGTITFAGGVSRMILSIVVPVVGGRCYLVRGRCPSYVDQAGDSTVDTYLSWRPDDTIPTVSDERLDHDAVTTPAFGSVRDSETSGLYRPASDGWLSVLLWARGADGSRAYGVYSVGDWVAWLQVWDAGMAPPAPAGGSTY